MPGVQVVVVVVVRAILAEGDFESVDALVTTLVTMVDCVVATSVRCVAGVGAAVIDIVVGVVGGDVCVV